MTPPPGAVLIPLRNRLGICAHAIIDACDDVPAVTRWAWRVQRGYPARTRHHYKDGVRKSGATLLHTLIYSRAGGVVPPGCVIDHVNRDKLDARRTNLRPASRRKNNTNTGPRARQAGAAGYKGVHWHPKGNGRWTASIRVAGRTLYLGAFADPLDAALAYDAAARIYHGADATTNADLGLVPPYCFPLESPTQ